MEIRTLQKRIGILLSGISAVILISHIFKGIMVYRMQVFDILIQPSNFILVISTVFFFVTIWVNKAWCRLFQIAIIFVVAAISIVDDHESFYGIGMYIMAIVLLYRFGYFSRFRVVKLAVLSIVYIMLVEISAQIESPDKIALAIDSILFVGIYMGFLWMAFEDNIRQLLTEKSELEDRIERDKPYTEMGEFMGGFIHNLKNDVATINEAIHLLEMGKLSNISALHDACTRLQNRIFNTTALIRARRTEGKTVHDGTLLVKGIRELFLSMGNHVTAVLSIEIPDTFPLYGNGEEISQVIENIVKNSFEAIRETGQYGKIILRGYDEQAFTCLSISNDGGPMNICAGCQTRACMNCARIGEGKTTKSDGSGIGLAFVRKIMKDAGGDMTIYSGPAGVETVLRFPKNAVLSGCA